MTKHWMRSSLPASLAVSEFHSTEAYPNLVLTNVQYSFRRSYRQRRISTHRQYKYIIQLRLLVISGPGSSVGIATDYGLDGPGIESRWGAKFSARPDRPWGPPSLLYNGYRVFPGGKVRPGVLLTTHPLLAPRSWKSRAIPLPPSGPQPGL
jgi:hypothetical protein